MSYTVLFIGVAASWLGIPIVGGAALATAGVLAGDGQLDLWLVIAVAAVAAWTGGYVGYLIGARGSRAERSSWTFAPSAWASRRRQRAVGVAERFDCRS